MKKLVLSILITSMCYIGITNSVDVPGRNNNTLPINVNQGISELNELIGTDITMAQAILNPLGMINEMGNVTGELMNEVTMRLVNEANESMGLGNSN